MEVIDIQAVKDCLAEVSDCEDKQYAIALLEWAIGKRTFDLDEHDAELLDKVYTELKKYKREINLANTPWNFIELVFSKLKAEVADNDSSTVNP